MNWNNFRSVFLRRSTVGRATQVYVKESERFWFRHQREEVGKNNRRRNEGLRGFSSVKCRGKLNKLVSSMCCLITWICMWSFIISDFPFIKMSFVVFDIIQQYTYTYTVHLYNSVLYKCALWTTWMKHIFGVSSQNDYKMLKDRHEIGTLVQRWIVLLSISSNFIRLLGQHFYPTFVILQSTKYLQSVFKLDLCFI